jgi:uncharacterized delta-60 repeat protein
MRVSRHNIICVRSALTQVCLQGALAATLALGIASAAPGDLDTSFSGDGIVTTAVGAGNDVGNAVAIQSDGKIVVAGTALAANNDFAVVRYNTDGTLDTSFSGDGMVTTPIGASSDVGNAVAIQSNGKIVVAGGTGADFALARYNTDGTLDTSFSGDGILTTAFGGSSTANGVAIQSDGKIIAAGTFSGQVAVARYNTDGSLDTGFSGDGKQTTAIGGNGAGNAVAIQSDGKIVVAGTTFVAASASNDFAVVRYNTDGSLDTSFTGDGSTTLGFGPGNDVANGIAIQNDGKLVVVGSIPVGSFFDIAVARYRPDGALDSTFSGGAVTTAVGLGSDFANDVAIQSNGKIVVVGNALFAASDFAVVRYNTNGSLDTTFSGDGKVVTAVSGTTDFANDVAIQSDGSIVAAGTSNNGTNNDIAVVRYLVTGCGSGVIDVGEACDDGNTSPGDCCSATCQFDSAGTACGSASDTDCTNPDTCNASGTCLSNNESNGAPCGDQGVDCRVNDTCQAGACQNNGFAPLGTSCGSSADDQCDNPDSCDASGTCLSNNESNGSPCGDQGIECVVDDSCSFGSCVDNGFVGPGIACGSGANGECDDPDTCTGTGVCQQNNVSDGSPCGDQGLDCRVDDQCQSGSCQDNGFATAGTACGSAGNTPCDNPDSCNASGSCLVNYESDGSPCGDQGVDCVADDACQSGSCQDNGFEMFGTACATDGNDCTDDACDGAGVCDHTDNTAPCEDGDLCTGPDACGGGACVAGAAVDCDDGSICTIDTCDSGLGCQNVGEPLPEAMCASAAKISFQLKNTGDPAKSQLKWKWVKGDGFDQLALGTPATPTTGTSYALCVYDTTGGTSSVAASVDIAPGTLWLTKDPKGWNYIDKAGTSDGVQKLQLKTGDATKTKAQVKAAGLSLPMPTPISGSEHFDQDPSVIVQLISSEGMCLTSEFGASSTLANDGEQFKAKAP